MMYIIKYNAYALATVVAGITLIATIVVLPSVSVSNLSITTNSFVAEAFGGDPGAGCCGNDGGSGGSSSGPSGGAPDGGNRHYSFYTSYPPHVFSPKPVCDISAVPRTITEGASAKLTWTTRYATSATINQGIGTVSPWFGQTHVLPHADTTYTMTVTGPGGTATCSASVHVKDKPQKPTPGAVCKSLTADPNSITRGDTSRLAWRTKHADEVKLVLPNNTVTVSKNGGRNVSPDHTFTYSVIATNESGSDQCNATVHVTKYVDSQPPIYEAPTYEAPTYEAPRYEAPVYNQSIHRTHIVYPPIPAPQPIVRTQVKRVPISHVPYTGPEDTTYALTMIGLLVATIGGAGVIYFYYFGAPVGSERRRRS